MRQGRIFERSPPVSSADKAPSVSAPPSRRSEEHLCLTDARASEAPGNPTDEPRQQLAAPTVSSGDKAFSVSVTPSHSQDHLDKDDLPAVERAPPQQEGAADGGFKITFSTPAHSRERNASNRPPPVAVAPAGSGAGSRRVHRERHRNSGDLGAPSTGGVASAEEPAPVHATPSPTASPVLKTASRPRGSAKKKFSYMGDNTWLKPKTDFPEPAPSPLELRTIGVPGECSPIQRNTRSTPASGSTTVSIVDTAGDAPALTARKDRLGFSSEAGQQLGQTEVEVETETSSQGTQRVFGILIVLAFALHLTRQ